MAFLVQIKTRHQDSIKTEQRFQKWKVQFMISLQNFFRWSYIQQQIFLFYQHISANEAARSTQCCQKHKYTNFTARTFEAHCTYIFVIF